MSAEGDYRDLVARARADDDILGLILTGSRGRGPFARPDSDWDVRLVVREGGAARYATPHGSPVEVVVLSLSRFERAGTIGSEDAWDRYSYVHAQVVVDKLEGRIAEYVSAKAELSACEAEIIAGQSLGAYVNS